ncbi:MAG: 4-hydroxythreonine-4-phosphate dehydrogenase PdxA [Bacteroidia bacterium]|nr:4-hydroxythreonine-4-phosphate dehydrogenase PdxA [Bacteroidia bacterium]MDW8089433.1 4-hydroxythreonine-4-phosphate dehydrogenase PdxA [Bacteroidia bacterium]
MANDSSVTNPRVGFSLGEPGGIGPQLLLSFLGNEAWQESFIPIVFGPRRAIEKWRAYLNLRTLRYHAIQHPTEARPQQINLIECGELGDFTIGKPSEAGGKAARLAFKASVAEAAAGHLDLLVTLPVDKSTFYDPTHFPYRGHTEYLRAAFPEHFLLMVMVEERLRVALLTEHLPLRQVAETLTQDLLRRGLATLHQALRQDFALPAPRIAVLGLNPHAGDGGIIGQEEIHLLPVLHEAWEKGILVSGFFSSDGFFAAGKYRNVEAVLALYHDQGLIPFKLLAGWEGFQYTAGLPFVRTAPDHGVAYDKAGKEEVDLSSLSAAVWEGLGIWRRRQAAQLSAT